MNTDPAYRPALYDTGNPMDRPPLRSGYVESVEDVREAHRAFLFKLATVARSNMTPLDRIALIDQYLREAGA